MQDGAHALQKLSVEGLGHSVVLWGVVGCEPTFRALLLEKLVEICASVLPSTIRTKSLDLDVVLSLSPSCKVFICLESFILQV